MLPACSELFRPSRWKSAAIFAHQSLLSTRLRTLLALLGIIVGAASVVALITIGRGVEKKSLQEFETMGTQIVYLELNQYQPIFENNSNLKPLQSSTQRAPLRQQDLRSQLSSMPEVAMVSVLQPVSCDTTATTIPAMLSKFTIHAIQPELMAILGLTVAQGRFLLDIDQHALWIVLGHEIANELQASQFDVSPGRAILICGKTFFIAGILAPATSSETTVPLRINESLLISAKAAVRLRNSSQSQSFILQVASGFSPVKFAQLLESDLSQQTGSHVRTITSQNVIELQQKQVATYTGFLTALSCISLTIGGLGVLNVMLVSVIERRREIGVRIALGADDIDIAIQFILESTMLSICGGLCGTIVGLLAALIVGKFALLPFVFSPFGIISAIVISTIIGITSGVYPALKASQLNPVTALQTA